MVETSSLTNDHAQANQSTVPLLGGDQWLLCTFCALLIFATGNQ